MKLWSSTDKLCMVRKIATLRKHFRILNIISNENDKLAKITQYANEK